MCEVNPWIATIWNLFIVLVGALTINSAAELKRSISSNAVTPTIGSGPDLNPTPFVDDEGAVPKIKHYLQQQEAYCEARIANHTGETRLNWCPCLPPNLRGRLSMNEVDDNTWEEIERLVGEDVLVGGEWKPSNCVSHTRMAVVIPCRDRDGHLRILLRHLIPILQRQLVHFRIFVGDQSSPVVFNKAATMNIGFLEARKRFNFNCVMFHDVDHLLEDDRTLMNCGPEPHHFALAMKEWDYRLNYGNAYGGVGAMTPAMFKTINGYSNIFFGWGGEDDDIGARIRRHWRILRPPHQIARYTTVNHPPDSSNPGNNKRHHLIRLEQEKYKSGKYDGLSDISYNVSQVDVKNLYTRVVANINVLNLPYPSHPIFDYTRVAGVCTNGANIMKSKDVSWQTCRYICDLTKNRPCIGFSYRPTAGSHRCSLLNTVCHLSRSEPGATYFKFGEPTEFTDGTVV